MKHFFLPLFLLLTLRLAVGLSAADTFILKETAVVSDNVVRMKDIALMDSALANRIGNLVVAAAPEMNQSGAISKLEITEKLKGNGIPAPRIEGPNAIIVLRRGVTISAGYFKDLVLNYIMEHSHWGDGVSVDIVFSKQITIPETGVRWQITPANGQDFFGSVLFRLEGVSEESGETIISHWLSARLRIVKPTPVTNRMIMKDETFTLADIRWEERELTAFTKDAILKPEEIMGLRAGRTIRANSVVTSNMMEKRFLVRRGAEANLTAIFKNLRATSMVKVLADGLAGDTVRVLNTASMKVISATVTGPNQLEVMVK